MRTELFYMICINYGFQSVRCCGISKLYSFIMTAYELGGQGSIFNRCKDFLSPIRPNRFYGSPNTCQEPFLFFSERETNLYRRLLPQTLRMSGINLYFRSLTAHRDVSIMEN